MNARNVSTPAEDAAHEAADAAIYGSDQRYDEPCRYGHYNCAQREGGACCDELWHQAYADALVVEQARTKQAGGTSGDTMS